MPLLTTGNIQDLFQSAGLVWAVEKKNQAGQHQIELDLHRTHFLGNEEDAKHHIDTWKKTTQAEYYLQGNMSAGNLFLILGTEQPFLKTNEDIEQWQKNYINIHFAYVNANKELCGFFLIGRRDEPSKWLMGTVQHTNGLPKDRQYSLLSSFDLSPFASNIMLGSQEVVSSEFLKKIGLPYLEGLLANVLEPDNKNLNLHRLRFVQLLRTLQTTDEKNPIRDVVSLEKFDVASFFANNRALDLVAQHDLKLTTQQLGDCLFEPSGLRKAIESTRLEHDYKKDKELLHMVIEFYAANVLPLCADILVDRPTLKTVDQLLNEPEKRDLILGLIKAKYNISLFKTILAHEAYYSALPTLINYGLLENELKDLFDQPKKGPELVFIHTLPEKLRELFYIFWIKGHLTEAEYIQLIQVVTDEPYLIRVLIDLDATKTYSIDKLKKVALSPLDRQIKIIEHKFADDFKQHKISKHSLKKIEVFNKEPELKTLVTCFEVLRSVKFSEPQQKYLLLLENKSEGKLLRYFLSKLIEIKEHDMRMALTEVLYIAIVKGVVSQNNLIISLHDMPNLQVKARALQERFICAQQVLALGLPDEIMHLITEETPEAARFRQIILKVDAECERMQARVRACSDNNRLEVIKNWQEAYNNYRKTVYGLAYDELIAKVKKDPKVVRAQIKIVEDEVLAIVDPEIHSWLKKILIVIANIIITACSLGRLNARKEQKTGNYWFFTQTTSGEELRALDKEIYTLIQPAGV